MTAKDWETTFESWKQGPSQTELTKADNAVRLVTEAIRGHDVLSRKAIKVFAQGSYRNRTNVRQDSDVDVCVHCSDTFYFDLDHAPGATREKLGFQSATYDFSELKRDVRAALVAKFGSAGVGSGDKAFDVHENTYRIAADVVPTFEWRDYLPCSYGGYTYRTGTVLKSEKEGRLIENYPQQHFDNGVGMHTQTARQYKKMVRILKRLRHHLIAQGVDVGDTTCSFLVESLVYNCPDRRFGNATRYEDVREVLADVWTQLEREATATTMVEVNGIKYLFDWKQPWTVGDAKKCVLAMWNYIGFGS